MALQPEGTFGKEREVEQVVVKDGGMDIVGVLQSYGVGSAWR